VEDIAARIDRHLDRSGEHHLWTGATRADGLGMVKVDGWVVTVGRVVWELAHGPVPVGARVLACPDERACVRLDHLRLDRDPSTARRKGIRRAPNGSGSKRRIRPGVWKLAVRAGRFDDGTPRRLYRTVRAANATEASRLLAEFVAEVRGDAPSTTSRELRDLTVDSAVRLYLGHLLEEKGRAEKTVGDYRRLHDSWFAETIGTRWLRDVDMAMLDAAFGRMQRAGRSRSTMHHAEALYGGLFRWAKARGIVGRNPMADFELPTSSYVPRERPPAEAEEMALLLGTAVEHTPEVLALLVLGATSGMRRGELVALRRSSVDWDRRLLRVEVAADARGRVKATKTRRQRTFRIDEETVAVLRRHCEEMDERAALFGVTVAADGFVFSLEPDCSKPMPPDWVTKRVAVLKEHLGAADKRPETIALEDEALRLFRGEPAGRRAGRTGPSPKGALTYQEIGARLGRSERWAAAAVASAERREMAQARGLRLGFDASVQGLRRFTSTELLDAGFNVSMVANRQGHSPHVLVDHYSKRRHSEDRRAAEHLGRVVHGNNEHQSGDAA
jgi:integrase